MGPEPFVIFAAAGGTGRWRFAAAGPDVPAFSDVAVPADAPPDSVADAVAAALAAAGYRGQGVVLAIPSAWCLCAAVGTDGLPATGRRQAMLYRLEEKLPVSAEDVVADFVEPDGPAAESGAAVLGVCIEKRRLAPLAEALESRGVAIEAICPASLLAVQELLSARDDGRKVDAVLFSSDGLPDECDLLLLRAGRPAGWYVLPANPADLRLHLGVASLNDLNGRKPETVLCAGLPAIAREALATGAGFKVIEADSASDTLAAASARAVLAGRIESWVNLRRDDLAVGDRLRLVHTPLAFAAAAVALFIACACGAMLWRAARYERLAAGYATEQEAVFLTVFPHQQVPSDVRSRLVSEERSLRGLSGGDPAAPPPEAPGLLALRDLLAHLPDGLRYRILDVRLEEGRFTVEGQARSYGDAGAIAAALRQGRGLSVEPPRTEQLPETTDGKGESGVSFTITGTVASPAAGAKPAGAVARRVVP